MRASVFVGRVGGLAVALGIGTGVAIGGVGAAWAAPADSASIDSVDSASGATSTRSTSGQPSVRQRAGRSTRVAEKPAVANPVRAGASDLAELPAGTSPGRAARTSAALPPRVSKSKNENEAAAEVVVPASSAPSQDLADQPVALPTAAESPAPLAVPPATAASPEAPVLMAPVIEPLSETVVPPVMVPTPEPTAAAPGGVVESVLAPISGNGPVAPVESAVSWVMLAAARRELGTPASAQSAPAAAVPAGPLSNTDAVPSRVAERSAIPAAAAAEGPVVHVIDPMAAATATNPIAAFFEQIGAFVSQIVTAITQVINQVVAAITSIFSPAPVNNRVPVVADPPTVGAPDAANGVVTGTVTATDADGDVLTYSAPATTAKGSVNINASNGAFTYTPTVTARENAAQPGATTADKTDTFTVTVTDGNGGLAAVPVTVQVGPIYEPNTVIAKLTVSPAYSAPRGLAISPDGRRVYVLNAGGGQVPVIDALTNSLVAPLTVTTETGFKPVALAVSPDGSTLYAANASPNVVGFAQAGTVSVVNIAANVITDRLEFDLGTDPGTIEISPDGERVYVTSTDETGASRVWVLDTNTNSAIHSLTGVRPTGLSVSPDSKTLYVGTEAGELLFVDTESYVVTGGVNIDGPFVVSPDGRRVYTSNSGTVSTVDTATNTVIGTVRVGSRSAGMAISPDGRHLYVADYYGDSVSVVNTATNTVTATIIVDRVPSGVVISPDGSRLYVASSAGGTVSVIAT